jgi:hypothetical protein
MRNLLRQSTSTAVTRSKQHDFPLASARDIGIFALFDLPHELIENIISEMINVLDLYRAVRLRTVNSELYIHHRDTTTLMG